MKRLLVGAIVITSLLAFPLAAQHGAIRGGGGGGRHPGNVVVPPLGNAVPPLGASNPGIPSHHFPESRPGVHGDRIFNSPIGGYSSLFDPFYGGSYAGYYGDGYQVQPSPSIIVLMPQLEMLQPPAPPPPPIRPETREYHWPASTDVATATTFSIVSKDRRVQSAVAVWVQDRVLCYVAPDGSSGRMQIDSIDRAATTKRNAEHQLTLWLPAGS